MPRRLLLLAGLALALAAPAFAHHGWGSYEASAPVTVVGRVVESRFENPHAVIRLAGPEKTWEVTLAPTSRMTLRGAVADKIAVGRQLTVYGYPSRVHADELRAEWIEADGVRIQLR